ncbi:MAG: 50S ribosomal protein L10 [Planctomycetota bacterium]|nr:50S ribosomal protein L10 [Planctomycetota bacterium]
MADRRPKSEKPVGSGNPNRINRLLTATVRKDYESLSNMVMLTNLGLNSEENNELRAETRGKNVRMRVVRNRLTLNAFREMGLKDAEKLFAGQTAIVDAEDPVVAAKLAVEFCKKFEKKLKIVGAVVEGKILGPKEVEALSQSKSKPELLADVVMLSKSPGARIAAQLKGPGGKIAGAIKALVEKLEKAGAAEPAKA